MARVLPTQLAFREQSHPIPLVTQSAKKKTITTTTIITIIIKIPLRSGIHTVKS